MCSWVSGVSDFCLLCSSGCQEKEELKEMEGHKITKWLKIEERELGLVATNQYPVAGAETEGV